MGVASLVCTYLYGSFAVIKTALEAYVHVAKNLIKRIDSLATTLMSTVTYVINSTMRVMINLVKQYEKELFDMLYNALFGEDRSFWCGRLWKCIALLNELLDSNSWLCKKIKSWMNSRCMNTAGFDIMDLIRMSVNDFLSFQSTVCSAGFTVEFGVSYIKKLFEWCLSVVEEYNAFLERNIRRLKLMAEGYLNTVIDWGVLDYLEKLLSFFTCAFDDSYSCSEIATASNFYNDTLSKLKLSKNGDGYDLSPEYKNALYGGLEGAKNQCSNLKQEIDSAYAKCVDPEKLKKANAAYNLSRNVLPGGMSWSDFTEGNWSNHRLVKKFKMDYDNYKTAWRAYKEGKYGSDMGIVVSGGGNSLTSDKPEVMSFRQMVDGTFIDEEGNVYIKDKCDYVCVNRFLQELPKEEQTEEDVMLCAPADNSAMVWGDEIISVTEAAVRIANDAEEDQEQIAECRALYEFINDWKRNPDGAIKYGKQLI